MVTFGVGLRCLRRPLTNVHMPALTGATRGIKVKEMVCGIQSQIDFVFNRAGGPDGLMAATQHATPPDGGPQHYSVLLACIGYTWDNRESGTPRGVVTKS